MKSPTESTMRIAVASDHAGFAVKKNLVPALRAKSFSVTDKGIFSDEPTDYPDLAAKVAQAVNQGQAARGILICGSGVGVCAAANKFPGIRAAICHDCYSAKQGVEHDDMNVLCLGSRVLGFELLHEIVMTFLDARFSGENRHRRRLEKLKKLEKQNMNSDCFRKRY